MNPQEMATLYEYNAWANRRMLEAVSPLSKEEFTKPLGSSFSSLRDTAAHIYGVEWLWFERFQGRSPSAIPDDPEFADVARLKVSWQEFEPRLLNFARALTQEDLDRVMEYKTMKFGVYRNPLWQSMMHLVNHGTYHRGQITTMLRQLDAQPILTDLMHFYREKQAAAHA
ncbi:MAG TPA: DinB family protein [Candidatus Eremiobacteraceae bacterium]|nr:DinB family protein [Candidatus Eremiobacteraceae bacterium]